jgi:hypothetical protein
MDFERVTMVMIPEREWMAMKTLQMEILQQVKDLHLKGPAGIPIDHITAKEFMKAVNIGRTKFDQLVKGSKVRVVKKRRKIYVPAKEVERYFTDPNVQ